MPTLVTKTKAGEVWLPEETLNSERYANWVIRNKQGHIGRTLQSLIPPEMDHELVAKRITLWLGLIAILVIKEYASSEEEWQDRRMTKEQGE